MTNKIAVLFIPFKVLGFISASGQKDITEVVKMLLKQFVCVVEFTNCFPHRSWMHKDGHVVIRSY